MKRDGRKVRKGLAAVLAAALAAVAATVSHAQERWDKLVGPGFAFTGDVSETDLRGIATEFAAIRSAIGRIGDGAEPRLPFPLTIVAIKQTPTLRRITSDDSLFVESRITRFIVFRFGDDAAKRAALRTYAALLIDNRFGPVATPAWLRAGLSDLLATVERTPKGFEIGRPVERPDFSREIDVESLLAADHYSVNRQSRHSGAGFFARSLALAHHLVVGSRMPPDRFRLFLAALENGRPERAAIADILKLGPSEIATVIDRYQAMRNWQTAPVEVWESAGSERQTVAAGSVLAELLIAGGKHSEAIPFAFDPDLPIENDLSIAVGLGFGERGSFDTADEFLDAAVERSPNDYRAYYARALVSLRRQSIEFGRSSGFSLGIAARARADLLRAIDLEPNFGDGYEMLAFLNSVREEDIRLTIDLMKKALAIAPGNVWYRLRMAELQIADRDFPVARRTVLALARCAGDDRLRLYAENTLTRMNSLELQLQSFRNGRTRESDIVTDQPLSEEELARRRAKALNESLNLALRIPREGDRRIVGLVGEVVCGADGISVSVRTDGGTLNLWNRSIENVTLVSYVDKLVDSVFGCGVAAGSRRAVVTFIPAGGRRSRNELVAIEFVPETFQLLRP